jgi:hypothetical protein
LWVPSCWIYGNPPNSGGSGNSGSGAVGSVTIGVNPQPDQSNVDPPVDFLKMGGFLEAFQQEFQARDNSSSVEFINDLIDVTSATASELFIIVNGARELHNIVVIESKLSPEDLSIFLKYATRFVRLVASGSSIQAAQVVIKDEFWNDSSISSANTKQAIIDAIIKSLNLLVDIMGIDILSKILGPSGLAWGILTDKDPVKKAVKELGFEVGREVGTKAGRALGTSVSMPLGFPGTLIGTSIGHMILGVSTSLSLGYAFAYAKDYMSKYGEQITNKLIGYIGDIWESLKNVIFPTIQSAVDQLMSGDLDLSDLVDRVVSLVQRAIKQIYSAVSDVIQDLIADILDWFDKAIYYITLPFKPIKVYASDEYWPSNWDTTPLL